MPAPTHAILVIRTTASPRASLQASIDAIRAQTIPPDTLTVVVCGDLASVASTVEASGATRVITTGSGVSFADAVRLAIRASDESEAVWLLPHDAVPDPGALAELSGALERGPSVAVAAPKLVRLDAPERIVSLGQTETASGRTFEWAADDYDQGQFDARDDVLGADIRGMLIRAEMRDALLPDPALLGVDEGLDIGMRAHLAGWRVTLVPSAVVAVPGHVSGSAEMSYLGRTAQLHRRLTYAPGPMLVVYWLLMLPLALWETVIALLGKTPWRIPGAWAAAVVVMARPGAVARSRRAVRAVQTRPRSALGSLRARREHHRQRTDDPTPAADRHALGFFSGGGAWVVLGLAAASVASYVALLSWPAVAGGGLLPLGDTVRRLWSDAASGLRPSGLHEVAPADPFAAVMAIWGSLWPMKPSVMLLVLWIVALPLSGLGGWFAATRVAVRPLARAIVAISWALSPILLTAMVHPRPAAVFLHVMLPWFVYAAVVAHRSWAAAGMASLLLPVCVACAPSLILPLAAVWAGAVILCLIVRPRSLAFVVWVIVPTLVIFAPIAVAQFERGTPLGILADPGPVFAAQGELREAFFGWEQMLAGIGIDVGPMMSIAFAVPLLALALLAPMTRRLRVGVGFLVIAGLGAVTAGLASRLEIVHAMGVSVSVWPGSGFALGWLALCCCAAITVDASPVSSWVRLVATLATGLALAAAAFPALSAVHRGVSDLRPGASSTLPAFVAAQPGQHGEAGTLVLAPTQDGNVSARVVWGTSDTLGGQSTLTATSVADAERADDARLADAVGDLLSDGVGGIPNPLRDEGVGFVLLTSDSPRTPGAPEALGHDQRVITDAAVLALDQNASYVRVGDTERGILWRVAESIEPRTGLTESEQRASAATIAMQVIVVLAALLLAVPTPASVRQARRTPRLLAATSEAGA